MFPYPGAAETKKVSPGTRSAILSGDGSLIKRHGNQVLGVLC
jgi:hypothetical protein